MNQIASISLFIVLSIFSASPAFPHNSAADAIVDESRCSKNVVFVDAQKLKLDPAILQKTWTQEEKQAVLDKMDYIEQSCPELVSNAQTEGKLYFYRSTSKPSRHGGIVVSTTCPEGTVLFDAYFATTRASQLISLVHELVHANDVDGVISYSPAWVSFLSRSVGIDLASSKELDELLADYTCDYILGKWKPSPDEFGNQILKPYFLAPTEEQKLFIVSVRKALKASEKKHYRTARAHYDTASKLIPSAPMPLVWLSLLCGRQRDYASALEYTVRAEECFKNNNIPESQSIVSNIKKLREVTEEIVNAHSK